MIIIRSSKGGELYVDGYRVRIIEKLRLPSLNERFKAIREAFWNTFLLKNEHVFLDMLTDSGVNAMSDKQLAAMITAQDSYAGSKTFYEFVKAEEDVLGYKYVLPTHQGRAAEHLLAKAFIKEDNVIPMNYHFTTTKVHFELAGGQVLELYIDEALNTESTHPFKGNMDPEKLREVIRKYGKEKIPFVRMEATTNLIGGQPFSMDNLRTIKEICDEHGIPLVLDGSMIDWNAYLIKQRERGYRNKTVAEIVKEMCSLADIFYASARKAPCVRGGFIATNNKKFFEKLEELLPVYEGFFTYGGMSIKELGAMAVGIREMVDESLVGSTVEQIRYFVEKLRKEKIPVVTPPGGLGVHLDAMKFLPHVPQNQYPAGALAAALYIVSGIRAMERGTMSMERTPDGREVFSDLELVRIAFPRRTYLRSHIDYAVDRIAWLYEHRELIKGLEWVYEPPVLRFFLGKLKDVDNWGKRLYKAYRKELGEY